MNELFPLTAGLVAGLLIGGLTARLRLPWAVAAAVVLGVLATVVSGEYAVSWGFLLVDIPLAAAATVVGLGISRALRRRGLAADEATRSSTGS